MVAVIAVAAANTAGVPRPEGPPRHGARTETVRDVSGAASGAVSGAASGAVSGAVSGAGGRVAYDRDPGSVLLTPARPGIEPSSPACQASGSPR